MNRHDSGTDKGFSLGKDVDLKTRKANTPSVLKTVYKNSLLNILTQVFVLAVTFLAIPHILRGLGDTSFGILSLVLVFIGYFSLVDLGVGRAVVKFIADKRSIGDTEALASIFTFSCLFSVAIGILVGFLIYIFAGQLGNLLFKVPGGMVVVYTSIRIVAVTMPFMILQGILRGTLMGYERFDLTNLLQATSGILQWGGIFALVLFRVGLVDIVWYVAVLRMVITVLHLVVALNVSGLKGLGKLSNVKLLKELLGFGGWVMVSQIVSPVLQYLERFVLSATIATSILPFYVIPYEATSKLVIFATAIASALFPGLSGVGASSASREQFNRIYRTSVRVLIYFMIPIGVLLLIFGHEILKVWIGGTFATTSLNCFLILVVAFVFNSVAQIPYTTLHAVGKPNITGVFHLVELPIHIFVVFTFVSLWGVVGAAVATLLRMGLDMALLFWASHRELKSEGVFSGRPQRGLVLPSIVVLVWAVLSLVIEHGLALRVVTALIGLSVYFFVIMRLSLDKKERDAIMGLLLRRG